MSWPVEDQVFEIKDNAQLSIVKKWSSELLLYFQHHGFTSARVNDASGYYFSSIWSGTTTIPTQLTHAKEMACTVQCFSDEEMHEEMACAVRDLICEDMLWGQWSSLKPIAQVEDGVPYSLFRLPPLLPKRSKRNIVVFAPGFQNFHLDRVAILLYQILLYRNDLQAARDDLCTLLGKERFATLEFPTCGWIKTITVSAPIGALQQFNFWEIPSTVQLHRRRHMKELTESMTKVFAHGKSHVTQWSKQVLSMTFPEFCADSAQWVLQQKELAPRTTTPHSHDWRLVVPQPLGVSLFRQRNAPPSTAHGCRSLFGIHERVWSF